MAVVFVFEENLVLGAYMVGLAALMDFLDGLLARLLNTHSPIGKQLDSLADVVSFGLVPGVMMYKLISMFFIAGLLSETGIFTNPQTSSEYLFTSRLMITSFFPDLYSWIGMAAGLIGFLITIFSAIRLAKFNLDNKQSDSFIGLPTPANTIFIASLPLIAYSESAADSLKQIILNPYFLISLSLISSFILVAPVRFFALKFKNFSWKDNKIRYIFLALSLALPVFFQFTGIPLIIVLYIILSIVNNLIVKRTPANSSVL